jgi:hypothetical protein
VDAGTSTASSVVLFSAAASATVFSAMFSVVFWSAFSAVLDSNETGWTKVMRGGAPIQLGARPVKREGRGQVAGVLTGDHLRPGMERGICTDALMPGQTVREDDRPLCRYA